MLLLIFTGGQQVGWVPRGRATGERRRSRPFEEIEELLAAMRQARERVGEEAKDRTGRRAAAALEAASAALDVVTDEADEQQAVAVADIAAKLRRAAEAQAFTDTVQHLHAAKIASVSLAKRIRDGKLADAIAIQAAIDEDEDEIALLLAW